MQTGVGSNLLASKIGEAKRELTLSARITATTSVYLLQLKVLNIYQTFLHVVICHFKPVFNSLMHLFAFIFNIN